MNNSDYRNPFTHYKIFGKEEKQSRKMVLFICRAGPQVFLRIAYFDMTRSCSSAFCKKHHTFATSIGKATFVKKLNLLG